jgi:hypothetical protein
MTTFNLDGAGRDEWPSAPAGPRVTPEVVAMTMSHGDSFPGKEALVPRSFVAICAYDGQLANVGRVVTDATWHHFVNVNISRSAPPAPADRAGLTGTNLQQVKQYFVNLATWLMPVNVRRCLRFPQIFIELVRYPLFEELRLLPVLEARGLDLHQIGAQVEAALRHRLPQHEVDAMLDDALEDGVGAAAIGKLQRFGGRFGRVSSRDAGLAALGALTVAAVSRLAELLDKREDDPHASFEPLAKEAARLGVRRFLESARAELSELDSLIQEVVN